MLKKNNIKQKLKTIGPVLLLVLIDQAIKIYISNNLMNKKFYIFNNILGFKPYINLEYSWLNSISNLGISFLTHVVFNTLILLISFVVFRFIKVKYNEDKIVNGSFIFLFAGELCSLIDKIGWGGSLDYILLKGLFIFDLKDVYVSLFEVTVVLCFLFNYKGLRKSNDKMIYNEIKSYIKVKYYKK
jgi:signal peptidase II